MHIFARRFHPHKHILTQRSQRFTQRGLRIANCFGKRSNCSHNLGIVFGNAEGSSFQKEVSVQEARALGVR